MGMKLIIGANGRIGREVVANLLTAADDSVRVLVLLHAPVAPQGLVVFVVDTGVAPVSARVCHISITS